MKLLLTSGGVTNPSIAAALTGLLGKPVEQSRALHWLYRRRSGGHRM
ncbi:hypothetical protein ACPCG0_02490 [Propionibacteriaceae bacterium Y1923]